MLGQMFNLWLKDGNVDYKKLEQLYIESVNIMNEFQDYRLEFFHYVFSVYSLKQSNLMKLGSVSDGLIAKRSEDLLIYMKGFAVKKAELKQKYFEAVKKVEEFQVDSDDGIAVPMHQMCKEELAKVLSIEEYIDKIKDQADKIKL